MRTARGRDVGGARLGADARRADANSSCDVTVAANDAKDAANAVVTATSCTGNAVVYIGPFDFQ